jgi:hypothetical protein
LHLGLLSRPGLLGLLTVLLISLAIEAISDAPLSDLALPLGIEATAAEGVAFSGLLRCIASIGILESAHVAPSCVSGRHSLCHIAGMRQIKNCYLGGI